MTLRPYTSVEAAKEKAQADTTCGFIVLSCGGFAVLFGLFVFATIVRVLLRAW
jgi:hypothetical protein